MSISAPTYQKPNGEPIIPAEWASPATTLVDSSPELGSEKAISPVEQRSHGPRNTLTITIPLPWKRRSRSIHTPADIRSAEETLPSFREPPPSTGEPVVSPEDVPSSTSAGVPVKAKRAADLRARMDARAAIHQEAMKSTRPLQSPRTLDLKSHMFPLMPVIRNMPMPQPQPQPQSKLDTRNVDALNAELEAMAVDADRARKDADKSKSPVDGPTRAAVEATWSMKNGLLDQAHTQASAARQAISTTSQINTTQQPITGKVLYYSTPLRYSPSAIGPPGQSVYKVLTPVEETHERSSQVSPTSNRPSGAATPLSPTAPATASLTRVALTPVDPTDPSRMQYVYIVDSHAPLASHPPTRPRRNVSTERGARARASSLEPTSRRRLSLARHHTSSATPYHSSFRGRDSDRDRDRDSRLPVGYIYNDPNKPTQQPAAYVNPRSRSLEPLPSPRHFLTPSPVTSVSSGSTDINPDMPDTDGDAGALADTEDSNSTTDEDPLFSPKDPDRYFEARSMWNGVAGEGRKGFYGNVRDDYRMIGKDVARPGSRSDNGGNAAAGGAGGAGGGAGGGGGVSFGVVMGGTIVPVTGSLGSGMGELGFRGDEGLKRKGLVIGDKVKIAGVDGVSVGLGEQALVPSAEELWG